MNRKSFLILLGLLAVLGGAGLADLVEMGVGRDAGLAEVAELARGKAAFLLGTEGDLKCGLKQVQV